MWWTRLKALIVQCEQLAIFSLPERPAPSAPAPAESWRERVQQGFRGALAKLSGHLVIRRRDAPVEALMDPQWEGLMRLSLRLLLEQAQMALLSGNQLLYGESLDRAGQWIATLRDADPDTTGAIAAELEQLSALDIAVEPHDREQPRLAASAAE